MSARKTADKAPPRKPARARRADDDYSSSEDISDSYSDDDEEATLAAFSTRSTKGTNKPRGAPAQQPARKPSQQPARKAPPKAQPKQPSQPQQTVIPYVGPMKGIDSIELCDNPEAGMDRHLDDMERLLKVFDQVVNGHEALLSKAVKFTEERMVKSLGAERRAAVEAATLVAEQAAEKRLELELRKAVEGSVSEAREAALKAQAEAVAEAVRRTEERGAEMQRLAVQNVTSVYQRAVGRPEEEIIATRAAQSFEEAAASAASALAASTRLELLSRDSGGRVGELLSTELDGKDGDPSDASQYANMVAEVKPANAPAAASAESAQLHFF